MRTCAQKVVVILYSVTRGIRLRKFVQCSTAVSKGEVIVFEQSEAKFCFVLTDARSDLVLKVPAQGRPWDQW